MSDNLKDECFYLKGKWKPHIGNQMNLGACLVFASLIGIEGFHFRETGNTVHLSQPAVIDGLFEQAGIDLSKPGAGVAGKTLAAYLKQNPYIPTLKQYPPTLDPKTGKYTVQHGAKDKIKGLCCEVRCAEWKRIDALDIDTMKRVIKEEQVPIIAGLKLCDKDFNSHPAGTIFSHQRKGEIPTIPGVHTVAIVGFGREKGKEYWIVQNSWGPTFCEKGEIRVEMGLDICEIESYGLFYPALVGTPDTSTSATKEVDDAFQDIELGGKRKSCSTDIRGRNKSSKTSK